MLDGEDKQQWLGGTHRRFVFCCCSWPSLPTTHTPRRTPHGALRVVQAMSAWLVKTQGAPSRHSRGCEGPWSYDYGHAQTEYTYRPYAASSRINICMLMTVYVPKLEYAGEVWEGKAKFVKQLDTVQMTAAKNILGCSSTTSIAVLRAELQ